MNLTVRRDPLHPRCGGMNAQCTVVGKASTFQQQFDVFELPVNRLQVSVAPRTSFECDERASKRAWVGKPTSMLANPTLHAVTTATSTEAKVAWVKRTRCQRSVRSTQK